MEHLDCDSEPEKVPFQITNHNKMKRSHLDVCWFRRKRYYVTLFIIISEMVLHLQRNNFILALVEMCSDKVVEIGNQTVIQKSEFQWNSVERGFLLSSISFGMLLSPLAGIFIDKYGGTIICGTLIFLSGCYSILIPFAVRLNITIVVILQILQGLSEGFQLSSVVDILFRWAPPNERSVLITNAYNGEFIGASISGPICSFLIMHFGWKASFFIAGGVALGWACVWSLLVRNDPSNDKLISDAEKYYLKEKIRIPSNKNITYPWKSILSSKAVWVLMNERFVEAWSLSFATVCLPFYIKDVQNLSIEGIGLISSLPSLTSFFGMISGSFVADYIRNYNILSTSNVHKLYISLGQISTIIALILIAVLMNFTETIILICFLRFCYGVATTSYCVLPTDIASCYAPFVKGLCITAFNTSYLLNPIIAGFIVPNHTASEWYRYLIFLSIFNLWGIITFYYCGTGELQSWAMPLEKEEKYGSEERNSIENKMLRNVI